MESIKKEILNKWIEEKRKEYTKEQKHWKVDSSFYYAFAEKIWVLDELKQFIDDNINE